RLLTRAVLYRRPKLGAHRSAACLRARYCTGARSWGLIGRPLAYARGLYRRPNVAWSDLVEFQFQAAACGQVPVGIVRAIRGVIIEHAPDRLRQLHAERIADRLWMRFGVVGIVEIATDDHALVVYRERFQVVDEAGHRVIAPQIKFDVRDVKCRELLVD